MTFPAKYPQLNDTELTARARTVLIRVIRVAFPHSRLPDGPYERTADIIVKEAAASNWFRVALTQGLGSLDSLSGGDFCALDDDKAFKVLKRIEGTDFFGFIRRTTVLNLYDDPIVWEALGYEGSSFEKGGYVNRGFDDLDWLPDPRVEEYEGPVTFEPIWEGPGVGVDGSSNGNGGAAGTNGGGGNGSDAGGGGAQTPAAADSEIRDNLKATLSTAQDPHQGAASTNSEKAGV